MRIGLLALCVRSEDGLHKTERHLETILGHAVPEVKILAGLGVFEWDVADDAKRDKGDGVAVADLGDGAALHIDGHGLGEMVEYLAHLLLRIDKPVAADGQSRLDTRYLQRLSLAYPIETVRGRYGGGVKVADGYYVGRNYLKPKQQELLKKLQSTLQGDDLEVMNSILRDFAL